MQNQPRPVSGIEPVFSGLRLNDILSKLPFVIFFILEFNLTAFQYCAPFSITSVECFYCWWRVRFTTRPLLPSCSHVIYQERDGFQKIVASYDADVTREVVPLTSDKNSQLQDMINNYRKLNEHLEQDLQNKDLQITQLKQRVTEVADIDQNCQV